MNDAINVICEQLAHQAEKDNDHITRKAITRDARALYRQLVDKWPDATPEERVQRWALGLFDQP